MGRLSFFTSAAKGKCLKYFVSLIPDVPEVVTAIHLIALGTLITKAVVASYQRRKVLQERSPGVHVSLIARYKRKLATVVINVSGSSYKTGRQ